MTNEPERHFFSRPRVFAAVCLLLVATSVGVPLAVSAQWTTTEVASPYEDTKTVVNETVEKPLTVALFGVLVNFVTFIGQRIAYDAAVALATAGNGEEPLINLQDPQDYFTSLGEDVGGAAVDALSASLEAANIHFNLCNPKAPAIRLVLQLGIKSAFKRPEPTCDWQNIAGNWEGFVADSFGDDHPDQFLLSNFAQAINPRTTDLTAGISLYTDIIDEANLSKSVGFADYLAKNGYKDVADVVTGAVKTPASVIEDTWKKSLPNDNQKQNQATFFAILQMKDVWKQLGLSMLSTFTNTLLSKFTDRIYGGLFDVQIDESSPFDVASIGFVGGVEAAEAHFRSILSFSPTKLDTYNIISEFTTCPGTTTRQLNYCVMDSNFATAVGASDSGDPFTVQEAIDEGLLGGDWPLISPTDSRNIDYNCYTYGFCYANLVRMRLARVIPTGWEMAATLQGDSGGDTLQTVIDAFDDTASPYYHLIDPNWVLKYPTSQCNALMAGQLVSDAGSSRGNECVDAPSCIREDASGTCVGGYGYCAREQNSWNFRGTDCPEEYATCLAFDNGNGTDGAWLLNTTDSSNCTADNAGCLWYSTEKEEGDDGTFDWASMDNLPLLEAVSTAYTSRVYFNRQVEECDSSDEGCTRVIEQSDDLSLNLLLNPSFETDDDADNVPDAWTLTGTSTYSVDGGQEQFGADAVVVGDSSTTGGMTQTNLPLQQATFYTLSFYAAQQSDTGSAVVSAFLILDAEDGSESVDLTGTSYDTKNCTLADSDSDSKLDEIILRGTPASNEYERFTCTFTSPTLKDARALLRAKLLRFSSTSVVVDGVQLEAGENVSDFREGYGDDVANLDPQYFKLPPAYLGCTGDADVDSDDCSAFAPVCSAQDVGCDSYTPANGDPTVPGITNDLDACPSECAGYDTFKQEPTNYEIEGAFPVYFIPSTAVACSATYAGCDEFTNLNDESLEYYTYLRACLTTAQTSEEANYYTWEGSDLEGFQLKSWTLLESDLSSGDKWDEDAHPETAPCTDWTTSDSTITCDDDASTIQDDTACNEHDDIFDEPDCREFYDADGNIHYRRFSDTVTISDVCADYRKTTVVGDNATDQHDNCTSSGGYFDTVTGECRYYGLPSESDSCPAEVNGCREYTGGTGRNSSIVYEDDVEDEDVAEYVSSNANVEVSNESVATDGHSIHITATSASGYAAVDSLVDQLASGKTYNLSFWAKSTVSGVTLTPSFVEESGDGTVRAFGSVTLSANWERYVVGPLDTTDFDAFDDTAQLAFALGAKDDEVYVDTITLRQTEESIAVIKDSWNTPATCDETPEGAASDQYYLGCQQYTNSTGEEVYLKSFTRLCSEEKIGCQAFFDTQSSDSPYSAVYNLTCERGEDLAYRAWANSGSSTTAPSYHPDSAVPYVVEGVSEALPCLIDDVEYCQIEAGESSCQFDIAEGAVPRMSNGALLYEEDSFLGVSFSLQLTPDTRVVNPDALTYFVANDAYACDQTAMGCMAVGLPTLSADQTRVDSWTDTYLLDVVDNYDDILCRQNALFCDAWDSTEDGTFYFKNPETKTCDYRTNVSIGGTDFTGWFRSGTDQFCYGRGLCSVSGGHCSLDSDCKGSTDSETDSCVIDTGTYLIGGTESGVWRNGDDAYDNWVGTCSEQYNLCSEFIDPVDVNQDSGEFYSSSVGASSFFLNNDLLDESNLAASKRCDGQVGQKKGCVLFENTTDAELNYNASASYNLSVHADQFYSDLSSYDLVDPVSCPDSGEYTALDGTTYDLCAVRCAYENELLHPYDDYASATGSALYTFTTSCLTNTDCPVVKSDGGDAVSGTCTDVATYGEDELKLEDDTNVIQKVNLDRACAEWLACNTSTKVWDDNIQAYINVCDNIGLCNEYTSQGESTSCANWVVDDVPTVLDVNQYQSRDVSWYGHDYSGLSIPDSVLAAHLSQLNVNPARWCVDSAGAPVAGEVLPYIDCSSDDSVCGTSTCDTAPEDFRLVLNAGSCDADTTENGESCTIGFCETSGTPCASDANCSNGEACQTGYCYYHDFSFGSCTSNADCDGNGDYSYCAIGSDGQGLCTEVTNDACGSITECTDNVTEESKADGSRVGECETAAKTQTGMCVSGNCLTNPSDSNSDGKLDTFSFTDAEELVCRGWPEATSPFGNDVVDTWANSADLLDDHSSSDPVNTDYKPFEKLSTFDKVSLCAGGQTCDCSYDTVTYGSSTMYVDQLAEGAPSYLCVGGSYDGAACGDDGDDRLKNNASVTCSSGQGTCTRQSGDQTKVGLQGFCLQRDTALTMNGDQNQAPCLAWLPVDRASGATDIYGKSYEAGYPLQDTYYCAEPAMYVDLKPSKVSVSLYDTGRSVTRQTIASAEHPGGFPNDCDDTAGTNYQCVANVACPDDYYALMGRCLNVASPPTEEEKESYAYLANDVNHVNDNDCPYVCIPKYAKAIADSDIFKEGDSCDNPTSSAVDELLPLSTDHIDDEGLSDYNETQVYSVHAQYLDFNTIVDGFMGCERRGIEINSSTESTIQSIIGFPESNVTASLEDGYRFLFVDYSVYPACRALYQMSSITDGNAAWTDRVLGSTRAFSLEGGAQPDVAYVATTPQEPFGIALDPLMRLFENSSATSDVYPYDIASCNYQEDTRAKYSCSDYYGGNTCSQAWSNNIEQSIPPQGGSFDTCASGASSHGSSNSLPESRSFIDFNYNDTVAAPASTKFSFGSDDVGVGVNRIGQIFANINKIYTWTTTGSINDGTYYGGYEETSSLVSLDGTTYSGAETWADTGDNYDESPSGPVVRSIGDICVGTNCQEGENGSFSINGEDTSDLSSAGGTFFADLKFFVEANPNQMPIRRVIVDWADEDGGDFSGSITADNYYKNRRGLSPTNSPYCGTAPDNWGLEPEACDSNFFNVQHYYTCSEGFISTLSDCRDDDGNGNLDVSPCTNGIYGNTCVYQPRVHVRDNWGWCTGECGNTSYGCFDGDGELGSSGYTDECNFEEEPSLSGGVFDPWVYYNGVITVEP